MVLHPDEVGPVDWGCVCLGLCVFGVVCVWGCVRLGRGGAWSATAASGSDLSRAWVLDLNGYIDVDDAEAVGDRGALARSKPLTGGRGGGTAWGFSFSFSFGFGFGFGSSVWWRPWSLLRS